MRYLREGTFIRFISYLVLGLMAINPAMALQYQQYDSRTDILAQLPSFQPRAFHIPASQKEEVIALLQKQGYGLVPASQEDIAHLFGGDPKGNSQSLRLAANFNLQYVYEKGCPVRVRTCYAEECNKYSPEPPQNCPDEEPVPPQTSKPKATPRTSGSISLGGNLPIPRVGSGGGNKNTAAALLVVIGVVVIAALFIYAGKWVIDALSNDEDYYAYWWDLGMQFTRLDTSAGEHGVFSGLKLSGGFVPNMHTNFGLAIEVGRMDLDLYYNQNTVPRRVNLKGTYWLIGPSVRWLIGNRDPEANLFNSSYVYLNLMGGSSDRDEVDKIATAKVGINSAIGENLRLGIHVGAFYLGLDEDEGFTNDGDNYWSLYGMELGYQF